MSRNGGILSGGFNGLRAPSAPAITGVTTSIGSASVAFTAPTDVGDAAVSSYVVTAVDESSGASTGATGSASPITVTPPAGGTFKIRMQALNAYGPGRLTEYDTGNTIYAGAELWAWGNNANGQIGDGTVVNRSSPVQVGSLTTWSQISSGGGSGAETGHAIKTDGTLWGWGGNAFGNIGNNTIVSRSSPVQVGSLTNWSHIDAKGTGHIAAIKTDGTLWTWGRDGSGQLGLGNTAYRSSPTQVGALTNWARAATGDQFCAAVKTDGTLWTWGLNSYGRLGDNTVINKSSPVQIGALTNWQQVGGGGSHCSAVKTDGTLWAWGQNAFGQLGDNTTVYRSSPVQVGSLTNWATVSSSGRINSAVKTDGTLWSWGQGAGGKLGDNTTVNKSSPVQIGALTSWLQVDVRGYGGSAVKTDGTLWSWGANGDGQLGDGTVVVKSSPVQIGSSTGWISVSAGFSQSIALYGVV